MKLAAKLFLSIALIILGTVAIGGIGISQMGRLATSAETVTGKTLPAALAIGQLNYLCADFRIMELQHIYAPETLSKEAFDQRAKPLFANFAAHLKTYLAQDLAPPERGRNMRRFHPQAGNK